MDFRLTLKGQKFGGFPPPDHYSELGFGYGRLRGIKGTVLFSSSLYLSSAAHGLDQSTNSVDALDHLLKCSLRT